MVLSCSVHGCINTPRKDKTISFHRFPKNPSVLTEWLIAIGRPNLKPTFERICSEHFHHDDFIANSGRRTLKCNAIPSIFEMTTEYVEMPVYTNSSRLNTTVGQQETAIPSESCDEVNTWQDNKNFEQSLHRMYSSREDALEHNYSMNTIPKTELDEAANEETTCFVGCGEPNVDDVKVEIEEFQDSSTDTVPTTAHFFRNESSETGATIKVEEQRSIPSFVGCEEPNADDFKVEIEEFQDSSTDTVSKTAHFFRNETGAAIKVEERRAIPFIRMSRVGLSGAEEEHQLFLLEGDISDYDIEISDEEEDILEVLSTNDIEENAIMEDLQPESEYDTEDELPVSLLMNTWQEKKINFKWQKRDLHQLDYECETNSYIYNDMELSALQYFKYFFDDQIIAHIVYQTNLYSVEKNGRSIDTNIEEIEQFLGIHILSGIVKMPSYRMYWAEATRYAPIADIMSRNRFDTLRTYLHLNENSKMKNRTDPDYDKLYKIRPVVDAIRANMATLDPEEHNSIGEFIIPFKGRSTPKRYINNKSHKRGIKVFARAGSSGIIYDFEIYVGKGTVKEITKLGISGNIVLRLCENIPQNRNFKLYCDNWFTSPMLFHELKKIGILATGTVRSTTLPDCSWKSDEDMKSEGRGSYDYRNEIQTDLLAVKWFDNKFVHVLSAHKGIYPIESVKRWSVAEKKYIQIQRPAVVGEYNKFIGGVYLHDMLVSPYRINIVVKRFYLRIFFNMIDMCIVNAWLLYKKNIQGRQKHKTLVQFRSEIAHSLLRAGKLETPKRARPSSPMPSSRTTSKHAKVPVPVSDIRYDGLGHFPVCIEAKQRCRMCVKNYSRIKCEKCEMALCLNKDRNCFKTFHIK